MNASRLHKGNSSESATRRAALVFVSALAALLCAVVLVQSFSAPELAYATGTETEEEKIETPKVEKEVAEVATDGTQTWGKLADAETGVEVPYRVTGTLPSNWDKFTTYYYSFHDSLPEALIVDVDSVQVQLMDENMQFKADLTDYFTTTYEDNLLLVEISDLKAVAPDAVSTDLVVLTYTAALDPTKTTPGTEGEALNYVYIEYTSKPWTDGIGRSTEDYAGLLTWRIDMLKIASSTEAPLSGATFTVQNYAGQYLAADGTLHDEPVYHVTSSDGAILISGVDSGTYTVTETAAPEGYVMASPFTITVSADVTADPLSLTAGTDGANVTVTSVDATSGVIAANITNTPNTPDSGNPIETILAKTGDNPFVLAGVVALAAIAVAAALFGARYLIRGKGRTGDGR